MTFTQKGHIGSKFSKKWKLKKNFFFFDNDSELKKGEKNDDKLFSSLNWSDT